MNIDSYCSAHLVIVLLYNQTLSVHFVPSLVNVSLYDNKVDWNLESLRCFSCVIWSEKVLTVYTKFRSLGLPHVAVVIISYKCPHLENGGEIFHSSTPPPHTHTHTNTACLPAAGLTGSHKSPLSPTGDTRRLCPSHNEGPLP